MKDIAECVSQVLPAYEQYPNWSTAEVSTGTTLVACEYNGGVVIGADSRTSSGTYVANRITDKLTPLTKYIFCCRSGSAADTQAITDVAKYQLEFHSIQMGREPTVAEAATTVQNLCYNYRDSLLAGIFVAGWDTESGGQIYSIPVGGMLIKQQAVIGGSGSTYLYGFFDAQFRPNMTKEEAVELVSTCVGLAINRDGSSGGCIRLGVISRDGVERRLIKGDEIPMYSYKA
ncbi:proteasome subunit beta type 6 [Echinococcus multilocularis]|uniref:proteasome endopeptidase complex n=1 Tax=Echinococcus multilocularis TaxID=6211 RepID=A0A087W174_ECHMU|nr:proteasome subunit beta type 6 [Echinococcus multilocularis]